MNTSNKGQRLSDLKFYVNTQEFKLKAIVSPKLHMHNFQYCLAKTLRISSNIRNEKCAL
ncbi:hypothetical protein VCHA51O444_10441 [Vibrio chagasii]|nr:hypothetical protein VCHA51O444_10441 [Vibrio chagasii]CAH7342010.1 hypothetical protein VCHA53O474_30250 [Vibrio chagasii]